jgi:hypothetical protein
VQFIRLSPSFSEFLSPSFPRTVFDVQLQILVWGIVNDESSDKNFAAASHCDEVNGDLAQIDPESHSLPRASL